MKTFYPTNTNKIQHIMNKVNTETGLSPLQEKAVGLIVNGKSYSDIAKELTEKTGRKVTLDAVRKVRQKLGIKKRHGRGICGVVNENRDESQGNS